jgi:hypothetical protein
VPADAELRNAKASDKAPLAFLACDRSPHNVSALPESAVGEEFDGGLAGWRCHEPLLSGLARQGAISSKPVQTQ